MRCQGVNGRQGGGKATCRLPLDRLFSIGNMSADPQ